MLVRSLLVVLPCLLGLPAHATTVGRPAADNKGLVRADFVRFALQIEASINAQDPALLDQAIDFDALVRRASRGIEVPSAGLAALKGSIAQTLGLGREICGAISENGSYKLLDVVQDELGMRARFRLLADSTLNYHELLLVPHESGIGVADCYVYLSGEEISQSLRRNLLAIVAQEERGVVDKLLGRDVAFVEHIGDIKHMERAIAQGDPRRALGFYRKLPEELQQAKNIMMLRLQAAQSFSDEEYMNALEDYREAFPNEPNMQLLLIDHYFMREQFEEAARCIEELDDMVGGDAYLDVLRGSLAFAKGDRTGALRLMRKAVEREPDMEDGYWSLIDVGLFLEDFETVAWCLTELENRIGYYFEGIENVEGYEAFGSSEVYRRWLEEQH